MKQADEFKFVNKNTQRFIVYWCMNNGIRSLKSFADVQFLNGRVEKVGGVLEHIQKVRLGALSSTTIECSCAAQCFTLSKYFSVQCDFLC